ncbi:MAG: SDR family NAD(P)-dependent oxidoreductase [Rhodobacteraceae bacterium]|nr:SDR family NAD(P)-dependent oxidoreductase [Paracoccaceae bacterium]
MNNLPLRDLHGLVTGGGTGIGLAIAKELDRQGANVTICGRNMDRLESIATGTRLLPIQMDVTSDISVQSAIDQAVARYGSIGIHIANAGIAEGKPLLKTSLEDWQKTIVTNLDGAFLSIKRSLESMQNRNWGRIIAIASVAGIRGLKGAPAYTASKHGLVGLIRAVAEEYCGSGITANAICPGYVHTPIFDRNVAIIAQERGLSLEAAAAKLLNLNRHKKIIEPYEIAQCVAWLCCPGSESINGQVIPIAGGQV